MGERKRERRAEKRERRERAIIHAVASALPPHQE